MHCWVSVMVLPMIMWYVSYFRRGEVCRHVAAVLFKVETAYRLGYTKPSCTSLPCVWNQAFSVKVSDQYTYCVYVMCTVPTGMCMRLSSVCVCVWMHDVKILVYILSVQTQYISVNHSNTSLYGPVSLNPSCRLSLRV